MAQLTFCIPAYEAASFISETLSAVQNQTFSDIAVLVSVDDSADDTESICRQFAQEDARFEVIVQPERLGWTGNVNALLDRVRTPYFCLLPHDDLIAATYAARLHALVAANPNCVVAYSQVALFGTHTGVWPAIDWKGTAFERIIEYLLSGAEAVPLRGVARSSVLERGLRLKPNAYEGFANEVIWVLDLLAMGDCLSVPEQLYRKRIRPGSVIRNRLVWPREKRLGALVSYYNQCRESVSALDATPDEQHALAAACLTSAMWRLQLDRFGYEEPIVDAELLFHLLAGSSAKTGTAPTTTMLAELIDSSLMRRQTARFRFNEGIRLAHGEQWAAAQVLFEEARELDHTFFNAHERLVHSLAKQRLHEEAVKLAVAGAARFLQDDKLLLAAARSEVALGRLSDAYGHVDEAERRVPKSAGAALVRRLLESRTTTTEGPA